MTEMQMMEKMMKRMGEMPDVMQARKVSQRIKWSRPWTALKLMDTEMAPSPDGSPPHPCEYWVNNLYTVTVRRYTSGWPFGGGEWNQLGIYCQDGEPRHDFRDMQRIKNDTCGPTWEAIELFPSEERLMDPSNYYLLWCAPKIPIGRYEGRRIVGPMTCVAPQRPWHPQDLPKDYIP